MNGRIGKKYLENYLQKTSKSFDKYLYKRVAESKEIGLIPAELTQKFAEIAKKGKRVRGALVVLGYEAVGGTNFRAIYEASQFIELGHTALLVHDDIQDHALLRRGLTTIHKQFEKTGSQAGIGKASAHYGISIAIDAGILGYYLSWEKLITAGFDPKHIIQAGKLYADYIVRVSHGQTLDIANTHLHKTSQTELINILRYKTAEYTGVLPLLVGATLAGLEDKQVFRDLMQYGLSLGWAFQIQDDILGTFGDENKVGKDVGIDIKDGKVTLLMLHLEKHGSPKQKAFLAKTLGNPKATDTDIKKLQKMLREAGSLEYVKNLGWKYVEKGKKYIPRITADHAQQKTFESLLYYIMERTL